MESPRAKEDETAPASSGSLHLNLFDDVSVTVIVEWTEPTFSGGYSLSGSLLGDPLGSMTLVVNGNRVVGSVEAGGQMYRIRSAEAKVCRPLARWRSHRFDAVLTTFLQMTDHGH